MHDYFDICLIASSHVAGQLAGCYHDCKTAANVVVLWSSAVSKIVKDDTKINKVCQALELPVIPPAELQFLKDYCSVVKPVSTYQQLTFFKVNKLLLMAVF